MEAIAAGSISGWIAIFVCYPFDNIRTRLQTEHFGLSLKDSVKQVYRTNGVLGFYKGFTAPFLAQGFYKAIIFGTNSFMTSKLDFLTNLNIRTFLCGLTAGSVNAMIVAPVELIRNQQLLEKKIIIPGSEGSLRTTTTVTRCLQNIVSQNGFLGLYRGLSLTIARDGIGLGIYFLTYKLLKENVGSESILSRLFAGSCAGVMFWASVLPLDTMKSMIQSADLTTQPRLREILSSFRLLSTRDLFRRLYVSWPIAFARGIPGAAITLTTYDLASQKIREMKLSAGSS
jgi:solute carrier family 25 (mitochondrial carnitine/acylcarnitine transporter), member 20/29